MDEYINREMLLDSIGDIPKWTGIEPALFPGVTYESFRGMAAAMDYIISAIKDVPAEDVAPVVRCRDCMYSVGIECGLLCTKHYHAVFVGDDCFCSLGERRGCRNDDLHLPG